MATKITRARIGPLLSSSAIPSNLSGISEELMTSNVAHIYISALPLAPSHSLVSQHYLPQYPHTLVVKAGPQTWMNFENNRSASREPASLLMAHVLRKSSLTTLFVSMIQQQESREGCCRDGLILTIHRKNWNCITNEDGER